MTSKSTSSPSIRRWGFWCQKPRRGRTHCWQRNGRPRNKESGGEGGIRTPGTLPGTAVFKTARFNRSRTSPRRQRLSFIVRRPAADAGAAIVSEELLKELLLQIPHGRKPAR